MYSPKALFQKQPAAIAGGIRAVLSVLVLAGLLNLGEELLAGVYLAAEVVLGLFVYQSSTPVAAPTLPAGTTVSVAGSEDKVLIEATPPDPTGVEGTH